VRQSTRTQTLLFERFAPTWWPAARYAEDQLANAFEQDVAQYVVLGAGLDTFAYHDSSSLRVPPGSGVAFDFAVDPKLLNLRQRLALHLISGRVAAAVELFQLFFRPTELAGELRNVGFQRTEILGAEETNARYFTDRADGVRVRGGLGQVMGAWI
jgi:O-methyltransferase involved in polyketide biosynthesis